MIDIKRILVINRLSQYTGDAVRCGIDLARAFAADLAVLRIIDNPVDMEAVNAPNLTLTWEEGVDHSSVREQYRQELEREVRRARGDEFPVKMLLARGDSVEELMRIVNAEKVDLIVSLAHEEGRLEHLLFGGENDEIIRRLPCSILLVKHEPMPVP